LISMDFMTHSSRIRLASSNTRFIRRSGTIHGAIATTSSGQHSELAHDDFDRVPDLLYQPRDAELLQLLGGRIQ